MRLTRKFIAALVIGVALVALIQGYLDYQRERDIRYKGTIAVAVDVAESPTTR